MCGGRSRNRNTTYYLCDGIRTFIDFLLHAGLSLGQEVLPFSVLESQLLPVLVSYFGLLFHILNGLLKL